LNIEHNENFSACIVAGIFMIVWNF
jgi:hypothetical protein